MEVIIKGTPLKISKKLVREAIYFSAGHLMSRRMVDTLQLHINFLDKTKMDDLANTDGTFDDDYPTPRMFDMDILNNMGRSKTLLTLGHEMVHVKQFATGEMHEYSRPMGKVRYRGKIYDDCAADFAKWTNEYFDYLDKPWEIEAYGREYALYTRFLHHRRQKGKA